MPKEKLITVLDMLPAEAMPSIDELGYGFLAEHGYDTAGATESGKKRRKLKSALRANGEELLYRGAYDKETGAVLVWFELYRGKERISESRGIKFLPKRESQQ